MLVVGNWKTYVRTREKAKKLLVAAKRLALGRKIKIVIAPPAPYLGLFTASRGGVALASQDVSESLDSTETGEVPAPLLKEMGVTYAIIGHSERRARGETDAQIREKVQRALVHGITPILCIGESERDADAKYLAHLRTQITSALSGIPAKDLLDIVIAYEPIWAIGKSDEDAIQPADLMETVLYIRKVLGDFIPGKGATRVKILYGGSAEPENARALAGGGGVDGFLVGHASVDAKMFAGIVKALKQ
ncbi:triose-phosphate isomerase [Patescibacteria group bacterium]|nr:triose-phosphate isomerase [Patescibacteria group bacterium]